MKRLSGIILAIALACISFPLHASEDDFKDIYKRYVREDGISTVMMDARMLKKAGYPEGVKSIYIIKAKGVPEFQATIYKYLEHNDFEIIGSASKDGERSFWYLLEEGGDNEFLLISEKPTEFSIIRIFGKFEIDDISRITRQ